jgi:hypothetical protein
MAPTRSPPRERRPFEASRTPRAVGRKERIDAQISDHWRSDQIPGVNAYPTACSEMLVASEITSAASARWA